MNKIAILTTTRADYGILKPLIRGCFDEPSFQTTLLVTGTHFQSEFGTTYAEIEAEHYPNVEQLPITMYSTTKESMALTMSDALRVFGSYFAKNAPDLLIVLGDRYETMAVCIAAMTMQIPIAHLHGGETTEGAIDECIRHSITKMSYLHFTSTEEYKNRVIQLGEDPSRVFSVGALGIDNILHAPLMTKEELEASLQVSLSSPFALVTFHPVTLSWQSALSELEELLLAIQQAPSLTYLFTYANADAEGTLLNNRIDEFCKQYDNAYTFPSLGMIRYLSACREAAFVLGNSSSGILEVPSFHIPTINVGARQKGRIQASSVINCGTHHKDILSAIKQAMDPTFRKSITHTVNPYGDGNTTNRILTILKTTLQSKESITLQKSFYDFPRNEV